ncbi:MAG: hypothetical protein P1P89_17930 [Desulfobacterales bacterium]|nr:hypothetical protein [Desulfobacterales bacterium]
MADKKDTFTDEVNNRLGEFFGNMDKPDAPAQGTNPTPQKDSELFELKTIVLSIEWEISHEIMTRLIAETDRLMKIYHDNKVVLSLLKLLDSVGRYINAKKANALPDSIKLLHSIHANLQRVVTSETITESQSSQILSAEIAKFKNLKQQLLTKAEPPPLKEKKPAATPKTAPMKRAAPVEQTQTPVPAVEVSAVSPTDVSINEPKDAALQAIDELKKLIKEEFKSLREELKHLRQ